MAACVELLCTGLRVASLTDGAFGAGTVEPFHSHALVEECWRGIGAGLDDCPDAFVADDGVIGAPAQDGADFRVTDRIMLGGIHCVGE